MLLKDDIEQVCDLLLRAVTLCSCAIVGVVGGVDVVVGGVDVDAVVGGVDVVAVVGGVDVVVDGVVVIVGVVVGGGVATLRK